MNEINQANAIKNARLTGALITQLKESPPPAYSAMPSRAPPEALPAYSSANGDLAGPKKKKKTEAASLEFPTEAGDLPGSIAG